MNDATAYLTRQADKLEAQAREAVAKAAEYGAQIAEPGRIVESVLGAMQAEMDRAASLNDQARGIRQSILALEAFTEEG